MTSRTDESRAARSGPRGTSNGMWASESVRLARTIRCAMVGSGARNARAISSVVSPPSRRRVRAVRASRERMGWQDMNTRRRRSSPMSSSIARWVSEAVTASNHTTFILSCKGARSAFSPLPLRVLGHLLPDLLFLLAKLGCEFRSEVVSLEYLADLDLGLPARKRIRTALDPFDRFVKRLHLEQPKARDQLLGLGERAVDHRALVAAELHARAFRAWLDPFGGEENSRFDQLFIELPHVGEELLAWHHARF